MLLIVFWSPKQSKIEESSIGSIAKQLEAHVHEEPKLWSFIVLFQKQIMNARRRNKEGNLTWRNSRGQQLLDPFRVLIEVHFHHTIFLFKAQEVRSPTLQTVCKSELKWKSCGHWNPIAPSWKAISQAAKSQSASCEISLFLRNGDFQLVKFSQPMLHAVKSTWVLPDICDRLV